MIRTRDFLLFLSAVGFLVLAITVTAKGGEQSAFSNDDIFSETDEVIYEAVLPENEPDKRSERLDDLRKKIAKLDIESTNLASVVTSVTDDISVETEEEETVLDEEVAPVIDTCSGYMTKNIDWSTDGLKFEVAEGARIIYRDLDNFSGVSTTSSLGREIVLQLPVRSMPLSSKKCLSDDVVGVALDGSLIRNNEYAIYGIFGAETLIGYALDGFPIYGMNDSAKTDQCGGFMEVGQYRYYLSSSREGVLGCYSGLPVNI